MKKQKRLIIMTALILAVVAGVAHASGTDDDTWWEWLVRWLQSWSGGWYGY